MKILFTLLFTAFLFCQGASAQNPDQATKERVKEVFGVRAGGNISNIAGDIYEDPFIGYHIGVFLDLYPGKKYGYGFELNYSKQGGNLGLSKISTTYIIVPVLFNLYVSEVALQGGVYAAPLLEAKAQYYYSGSMSNLDYGLAFGIKRSLGLVGVSVRYYHGLQTIAGSRQTNDKEANNNLQLSLRINLNT